MLALGVGLVSSAAFGLPWDVDMADSQAIKAFEQEMEALPPGVISQDNALTPTDWTPVTGTGMAYRTTEEGKALEPFTMMNNKVQPLDITEPHVLRVGEEMFDVYCTPCHGDGQTLGAVAAPGRFPGVPVLSGSDGRLQDRTDAEIYLTVMNGWGLMPNFDWAVSNDEAWAIVGYVRTLNNGAYRPPIPDTDIEEGAP